MGNFIFCAVRWIGELKLGSVIKNFWDIITFGFLMILGRIEIEKFAYIKIYTKVQKTLLVFSICWWSDLLEILRIGKKG